MKYLGGKARIAKRLVRFINLAGRDRYVEPFVGGLNVVPLVRVSKREAFDISQPLISLYAALQKGWQPPSELNEDQYYQLRESQDPENPLTAFAGYACSYSGKFFGGFARDGKGKRNYAAEGQRALLRDIAKCEGVEFKCKPFWDIEVPKASVVYCDPPYAGTTGFAKTGKWDSDEFWRWVESLDQSCAVFVSEYRAPDFMDEVMVCIRNLEMGGANGVQAQKRIEKLYRRV